MSNVYRAPLNWYTGGERDSDVEETEEWLTAFDEVVAVEGRERACFLLQKLLERGYERAIRLPFTANTPYINTIPVSKQPAYAGDRDIERRIKSITRWNAMAMVVRANKKFPGLGGHISTFASAATLYQVNAQKLGPKLGISKLDFVITDVSRSSPAVASPAALAAWRRQSPH